MNWLTDFFDQAPESFDTTGKTVKNKRLKSLRQGLKIRRGRAKSAWKQLSKRQRRKLVIALVLLLAVAAIPTALWLFPAKRIRSENFIASMFPAPAAPALPVFEIESLATDPAAMSRRWKYIVVHHSGGNAGSAGSFDTYHREIKGWQSLGYHFVIGNGKGQGDGKIAAGPRWYGQQAGAHAHSAEHNEFGIGICLVGNFDAQNPTPAQWHSLVDLVKRLSVRYGIPAANIVGHSQIRQGGSTACPGKNLNVQALRDAVFGE